METKCKTRKVIKVGGSLGMTLPKEFVVKNKLETGDKLGVTFDSILVIVVPHKLKE